MSQRLVVIGGGLVGLLTARNAKRRGWDVTIVSEGPMCSDGNAGMIVPSHFEPLAAPGMVGMGLKMMMSRQSPLGINLLGDESMLKWAFRFLRASTPSHVEEVAPVLSALHLASRDDYIALEKEIGDGWDLTLGGMLTICETSKRLEEESRLADRAVELGQQTAVLSPDETIQRFGTDLQDIAGAVEYKLDAYLNPKKLVARLQEQLRKDGVEFLEQRVENVLMQSGRLAAIGSRQFEIDADEFVLSAGVGSRQIAQMIGWDLPIVSGKGYSFRFPERGRDLKASALFSEARVAVTPMGGDLSIAGTMELGSNNFERSPNRIKGVETAVHRIVPGWSDLELNPEQAWVGHRPVSPDGMPYLGRTEAAKNLIVATGHAMMGVSLAPVTAEMVTEVLTGVLPPVPIEIMDPDRYAH